MNIYLKEGRIETESKDCAVIALAYAFDIDYEVAHKICKDGGRKDNDGFSLHNIFRLREKDFRQFTFKSGDSRVVTRYGRPKMSAGRFRDNYKEGVYIVGVGGHYFTLIDGVIFNNGNDRKKVAYYYKVSKPLKYL